uniref:SanA-related protein n=1 Tax=Loa loa TaxID=7209 RepID=A0A1I7VQC8_LOALO
MHSNNQEGPNRKSPFVGQPELAPWLKIPSPSNSKICQQVIPSVLSPYPSHYTISNKFFFSMYDPTLQANPMEKVGFYTDLRRFIQKVPPNETVIILGKHGIGNYNYNGRFLLEFCAEQQLTIINTIFQERHSLKTIYMHPRSQHWHITDSVLVCQRTHVMSSAERRTDHPLYDVNSTWALNPNLRETLFSANRAGQGSVIQHITQQPVKSELDITSSAIETLKAIPQVKTGKAAGIDDILPEIWKQGG